MDKLNEYQKNSRKAWKQELTMANGMIAQNRETGVTVVITPNDKIGGFANISIAYCSPGDKFSRKYGEYIALLRWENGERILVPLNGYTLAQVAYNVTRILA